MRTELFAYPLQLTTSAFRRAVERRIAVGIFAGDSDFALRWPEAVLAEELRRLIVIGERDGLDSPWSDEVELLLQQAFSSAVPAEDFRRVMSKRKVYDSEPF